MSLCPLLPPKAAPQGAAGHRTPTGHPGEVRAGLRGCSSASRWEECPQQAPAKLPVLGGTRHKLLTDLCERLQPPEPCGNCKDTWLCSPALVEQAPQAMGWCRLAAFGGAGTAPQLVQRPVPLQYLDCGCASLRSCREGGCRGGRKWWLGILFWGSWHPAVTQREGEGDKFHRRSGICKHQLGQAFWQRKFQEQKCHKPKFVDAGLGGHTCSLVPQLRPKPLPGTPPKSR